MITAVVGVLREKVIAIILGPIGVGTFGLLMSFVNMIGSILTLGLPTSAIRSISQKDSNESSLVLTLRSLLSISALFGLTTLFIFSKRITALLFGSSLYINETTILIISSAIVLLIMESGELAILQAKRQIKTLALSRIFGSLGGALSVIPIYRFFGMKGIPYAIVSMYFFQLLPLLLNNIFFIGRQRIQLRLGFKGYHEMLSIGLYIMVSALLVSVVNLFTKNYIDVNGGTKILGCYEAGNKILNGYVGLMFVVMAKDFYPRISEINTISAKVNHLLNAQVFIAWLILLPLLVVVLLFSDSLVRILYTDDFILAAEFLDIAALGIVFKMIGWVLSYVVLAKGDSRLFFTYELLGNILNLVLNVFLYDIYGIEGLGLSFLLYHVVYALALVLISLRKYSVLLNRRSYGYGGAILSILVILLFCKPHLSFWLKVLFSFSAASLSLIIFFTNWKSYE